MSNAEPFSMPEDTIPERAPIDLFTAENFMLIKSGSYCLMIFKFIHVETCTNGSFILLLNGFFIWIYTIVFFHKMMDT